MIDARHACTSLLCGVFLLPGCATMNELQRANRLHASDGDAVNGSRLLLERDRFTGGGGFESDKQGLAGHARQDGPMNITDPASLASAVPGTMAGTDINAAPAPRQPPVAPAKVSDAPASPAASRVVVYTAALRIVVPEIDPAQAQAKALADSCGGYVQEIVGDTITIRVPAARFDEAMSKVEVIGHVVGREVKSLDVTEEYVDLEARLKSAERMRDRLQALLEKAGDVKAMLEVERELGRVNEEIEKLTGKINVLKNRVAFSAITVRFERVAPRVAAAAGAHELPFYWLRELRPDRLWE